MLKINSKSCTYKCLQMVYFFIASGLVLYFVFLFVVRHPNQHPTQIQTFKTLFTPNKFILTLSFQFD